MRVGLRFSALCVLAGCAAAPGELGSLPDAMIGTWGRDEAACLDATGDGRVEIDARAMSFAASYYDLRRITRLEHNSIRADAVVQEEGYEEAAPGRIDLTLRSMNVLTVSATAETHDYVRCVGQVHDSAPR